MSKYVHIRFLSGPDQEAFQQIRLQAIDEHPEEFVPSSVEESQRPRIGLRNQYVHDWTANENALVGAFVGDELVGVAGIKRSGRIKQRHKAYLWLLYVRPGYRRGGVGRQLLNRLIGYALTLPDLERITLHVSTTSEDARRLYHRAGFVSCGLEPEAIKADARYVDVELMSLDLKMLPRE